MNRDYAWNYVKGCLKFDFLNFLCAKSHCVRVDEGLLHVCPVLVGDLALVHPHVVERQVPHDQVAVGEDLQ